MEAPLQYIKSLTFRCHLLHLHKQEKNPVVLMAVVNAYYRILAVLEVYSSANGAFLNKPV